MVADGESCEVGREVERDECEPFAFDSIHVMLPMSCAVQNHMPPYACGTQMTGIFSNPDILQAEAANYYGSVGSRCDKQKDQTAELSGVALEKVVACTCGAVLSGGIGWLVPLLFLFTVTLTFHHYPHCLSQLGSKLQQGHQ